MEEYIQFFNGLTNQIGSIGDSLKPLKFALSSLEEPLQQLVDSLKVTNIFLGIIAMTSIGNLYIKWKLYKRSNK